MNTTETIKSLSPEKKTALCIAMSLFYCAMLAYPFGVATEGYVWQRALLAGVVLFIISIPAWIVNVKREFFDATATEGVAEKSLEDGVTAPGAIKMESKIGELARMNKWLTLEDISQILYCQGGECSSKFGQIAVKRNYLTPEQLETLLSMQGVRA